MTAIVLYAMVRLGELLPNERGRRTDLELIGPSQEVPPPWMHSDARLLSVHLAELEAFIAVNRPKAMATP